MQIKDEQFKKISQDVDHNLNLIKEKEAMLLVEKDKLYNKTIKLQKLEKEMSEENDKFKKAYQKRKDDQERLANNLEERKRKLDSLEKQLKIRQETLEIKSRDIENKTANIGKLNEELDDNKKSLNT